ncbi:mitochondrial ribosome and complex I assembly factor AltMIEF1 [Cloeon dipterum]|uniref:mitochondrial ribosome and complex I assembly factor AltMIEF1 n=1 Tax=Cloeon dipterum TaxID=197152 RepID=UPI00321FA522
MSVARSEVLRLYKSILKYGQELKYTDRDFFKKKIRKEFRSCKSVESPEEIKFHIDRAKAFLQYKRVL